MAGHHAPEPMRIDAKELIFYVNFRLSRALVQLHVHSVLIVREYWFQEERLHATR
jgi:hypothetical protein